MLQIRGLTCAGAGQEVENQVTELRSGLQLVQRAQEGLERHQMDAMASVIQDVQRTSSEVRVPSVHVVLPPTLYLTGFIWLDHLCRSTTLGVI